MKGVLFLPQVIRYVRSFRSDRAFVFALLGMNHRCSRSVT
jgi:hypothetical protein